MKVYGEENISLLPPGDNNSIVEMKVYREENIQGRECSIRRYTNRVYQF